MAQRRSDSRRGYRKVTYPAALRMAKLVDEMPRHGIGRRLKSVAEGLGLDGQTVRRYVRAMAGEFVTEDGELQFVIEKKGRPGQVCGSAGDGLLDPGRGSGRKTLPAPVGQ